MAATFFETLNYSSVNEDWRTETAALSPGPADRVLCVTGSGDRPLNLLAAVPARVVAIDANPAQNHLLLLKIVALQFLSFDEYVAFLGLREAEPAWRQDRFLTLSADLPVETRRFWEAQAALIAPGVLYQGRWERFYRRLSRVVRLIRPRTLEALFEFKDIEAQRRFVDSHWDTFFWRQITAAFCGPFFSRLFLGDPAYYRHVNVRAGSYICDRMRASLHRYLASENFMVSLVLRGELTPFDLPPYLTRDGAALLRDRLDRIEVVTADLPEAIERFPESAFTRFSLSDVSSFLDGAGFDRLLRGVWRCAAPGARFCIREFLTRHAWTEELSDRLLREPRLEAQLAAADRAFAYDFLVGQVQRG